MLSSENQDPDIVSALEQGMQLFNKGEYFEAHEIWEEAWGDSQMDERHLLQGLIQVAAGLYKLQIGQPSGTAKLLEKALGHLRQIPTNFYGLNLDEIIQNSAEWQKKAVEMVQQWQTGYDESKLPSMRFLNS